MFSELSLLREDTTVWRTPNLVCSMLIYRPSAVRPCRKYVAEAHSHQIMPPDQSSPARRRVRRSTISVARETPRYSRHRTRWELLFQSNILCGHRLPGVPQVDEEGAGQFYGPI